MNISYVQTNDTDTNTICMNLQKQIFAAETMMTTIRNTICTCNNFCSEKKRTQTRMAVILLNTCSEIKLLKATKNSRCCVTVAYNHTFNTECLGQKMPEKLHCWCHVNNKTTDNQMPFDCKHSV